MTSSPPTRRLAACSLAAVLSLAGASAQAANAVTFQPWGGAANSTAPTLAPGQTIGDTQSLAKSNFGDNPALFFSAWAHAGGAPWYAFQLTSTATVQIDLTPVTAGTAFAPGLTLWASGASLFDGGSEGTGAEDGTPHSFNAVGQVATPDLGTGWMASGGGGNMLQTLAYAVTGPSHTDSSLTGWGEVIRAGVNDVRTNSSFASGVTGTASGNSIHLTVSGMQAGWYTLFIGGTDHSLTSANMALSVSALAPVPEPGTWALMAAGLGLVALRRRRA